ncbi:sulfite exporter TauE/SafE family protein [Colwellia chukchiensis]|uniref:sulfite exporter TauE/SafE family protein n=1 Tax=Colwellia chukchiensis TaxID=641665 RepID=UPI000A16E827|nr:TSUP family transporter [Colwellia chukchiensis]
MVDPVLDLSLWITLCSVGFVAGLIDAIAGGGGMLTVPTLLTSGLPPHVALGTNKLAASFGSSTASFAFYRKKLFNPKYWRVAIIATAIGAIIGTLIVNLLSVEFLDKYIPVLIILTAVYTLVAKSTINQVCGLPIKTNAIKCKQMIQGLVLGFYDGVAGPGTGAFWVSSSSVLYKIDILLSSGLARATNFVSNFFSLITFIYLGHVNFLLGLSMGLFIMLGAWVGAHYAIKFGGKFIRPVFITVVILMSINLAHQAWFS